jgi:hypothetical protein
MLRRLTVGTAVLAALLLVAPSASALPPELGDRCVANDVAANETAIVLNNGLSGLELPVSVPPEGSSVITRWRVQAEPGLEPIVQQLVAFKQADETEDLKVGESALETVVGGTNEFATRIPVPEYGHIGLRGPTGTLLCSPESEHLAGIIEGPWTIGETRHFKVEFMGVPVTAVVEPDRDGDGYGDETQDGCPQSAAYQSDCPAVVLNATGSGGKRLILVQVKASSEASVHVFGQISWRVRQKPNRGADRTAHTVGLTVGLSGGTKLVAAGQQATRFRIPLPKSVLRRLGRITPMESLKAKITVSATDLAGRVTNRRLTVKLKGRDTHG